MRSPLAEALRKAAAAPRPARAFLRRDRGEALFVTDAPRHSPDTDWATVYARLGFDCRVHDGLARLSPGAAWLAHLEAEHPDPPDALCAGLRRFSGLTPDPESLRLFAMGARLLDGEADGGRFDRLLRQRAAVCLRLNRASPEEKPRGGGLYACALLAHATKEERT